mgnify:CR=1 FL=1
MKWVILQKTHITILVRLSRRNGVDLLITAGENMKYLAQGAKDNGVENIVSI